MALDKQGKLWAWGDNYSGNLGDGTSGFNDDKSKPVKVKLPDEVVIKDVHAAGAGDFSLALDSLGRVWAWGSNVSGQLGTGGESTPTPARVNLDALASAKVVSISVDDEPGQIDGFGHSLVLDEQGRVWSWGWGYDGELGNGATKNSGVPVKVDLSALGGIKVKKILAAGNSSLALDELGRAWAWGDNYYGQLGDGTTTDRSVPVAVKMDALNGAKAVDLYTANERNFILDDQGRVWAWGSNYTGQLGDGSSVNRSLPVAVKFPVDVKITALHVGENHALAIDMLGRVWAWGSNVSGRLGDGTTTSRNAPVLTNLDALKGARVVEVQASENYSLALDDQGRVWAWGYTLNGQLGIETKSGDNFKTTPVLTNLNALGGVRVVAVGEGDGHNLALDEQSRLWSWGYGYNGQIGNGTEERDNPTPVQVVDLPALPLDLK